MEYDVNLHNMDQGSYPVHEGRPQVTAFPDPRIPVTNDQAGPSNIVKPNPGVWERNPESDMYCIAQLDNNPGALYPPMTTTIANAFHYVNQGAADLGLFPPWAHIPTDRTTNMNQPLNTPPPDQIFECVYCQLRFPFRSHLQRHISVHLNQDTEVAQKVGMSEVIEARQVRAVGNEGGLYHTEDNASSSDSSEGKEKSPRKRAREYKKTKSGIKCGFCNKYFPSYSKLERHENIHRNDKSYLCETCGRRFNNYHYLLRHTLSHGAVRPYQCKLCDKNFTNAGAYKKHVRTHSGVKPFKCETCGKAFMHKASCVRHQSIHTGERPYQCERCPASFRFESNRTSHMKIHLRGDQPPEPMVKCRYCPTRFTSWRGRLEHERMNHADEIATSPQPKRTNDLEVFKCHFCPKVYYSSNGRRKHMRLDHRDKKIPLQEKPDGDSLNDTADHATDKDPSSKSSERTPRAVFKCRYCKKAFYTAQGRFKHVRLEHQEEVYSTASFKCRFCPRLYVYPQGRRRHEKQDHNKVVPVEVNKSEMMDKPQLAKYQCQFCTKVFFTAYGRTKHEITDHKSEKEKLKVFKCYTCFKVYYTPAGLRKHEEVDHMHGGEDGQEEGNLNLRGENGTEETAAGGGDADSAARGTFLNATHSLKAIQALNIEEGLKCKKCSKIYYSWSGLRKHVRLTHKGETLETLSRAGLLEKVAESQDAKYQCRYCPMRFHTAAGKIKHENLNHKDEKESTLQYKCHICLKVYYTLGNLRRHEREFHDGEVQSAYSDVEGEDMEGENESTKSTPGNKSQKDDEMGPQTQHSGNDGETSIVVEGMKCQFCSKIYYSMSGMRRHLRLIHKEERDRAKQEELQRIKLEKLNAAKNSVPKRRSNSRRITPKQQSKFQCTHCSLVFSLKSELNKHMEIHKQQHTKRRTGRKSAHPVKWTLRTEEETDEEDAIDNDDDDDFDVVYNPAADGYHSDSSTAQTGHVQSKRSRRIAGNHTRGEIQINKSQIEEQVYPCRLCSKVYYSVPGRRRHEKSCAGDKEPAEGEFVCQFCPNIYTTAAGRTKHLRLAHKDESQVVQNFQCRFCPKKYSFPQGRNRHERLEHHEKKQVSSSKVASSSQSHKSFNNSKLNNLRKKKKNNISKPKKHFRCQHCNKICTSSHSLEIHELRHSGINNSSTLKKRKIHQGGKQFQCMVCGESFTSHNAKKKHEKSHAGEGSFTCRFCSKVFRHLGSFRIHQKVHLGERLFKCKFCQDSFRSHDNWLLHVKTHAKYKERAVVRQSSSKKAAKNRMEESASNAERESDEGLNNDDMSTEKQVSTATKYIETEENSSSKSRGKCDLQADQDSRVQEISSTLNQRPAMENVTDRSQSHEVNECAVSGNEQTEFRADHNSDNCREPHDTMTDFVNRSEVRGAEVSIEKTKSSADMETFTEEDSLALSQNSNSAGFDLSPSQSYTCQVCKNSFRSINDLLTHEKQHFGQKIYKCSSCSKTFPWKSALSYHEKTHTADKSFLCQHCGKSFKYSHGHMRHLREVHGVSQFKVSLQDSYQCRHCPEEFDDMNELSAHEEAQHDQRELEPLHDRRSQEMGSSERFIPVEASSGAEREGNAVTATTEDTDSKQEDEEVQTRMETKEADKLRCTDEVTGAGYTSKGVMY